MVPLIVSIIVPLLLYFMNKASKRQVIPLANGGVELRMNGMYLVVGICGFAMSVVFLIMPVLADEYSAEIFIASGLFFVMIMALSVPCFLWYKNHRLLFNDAELITSNPYGHVQSMNWDAIKSVRFKTLTGVIELLGKDGNTIKVHQHLVGVASFVKMLLLKREKYHFVGGGLPVKLLGLD